MDYSVPRKPRYDAKVAVTLCAGNATNDGVIVNLHEDGAGVEIESSLNEGDEVTFVLLDSEVNARIAWRKDHQMGLSFTTPIPSEWVAAVHSEVPAWVTY
jgi:hypothetical protein